jgi:hypothetical protein
MSIVIFEDNYFDFNRKGANFLISLTFFRPQRCHT